MKCFQCALKHVATALSYGKEIIAGHGYGADLDHRIDFLGQITNLEDHLKLIDTNLLFQVKNFRQYIQAKQVSVNEDDLETLRQIYKNIENIKRGQNKSIQNIETKINQIPCVLFLNITNKEYFDLCYKMLKQNLIDYNKIYYLNSNIDLTEYDMEKIQYKDINQNYIYIINEKTIILKQMSAKALLVIADYKANFNYKPIMDSIKENRPYYYYDNYPCLIKKNQFQSYIKENYPLTYYCNKYKSDFQYKYFQVAIKLDKKLCCSNKQKIKTVIYCYIENNQALESIKNYLNI